MQDDNVNKNQPNKLDNQPKVSNPSDRLPEATKGYYLPKNILELNCRRAESGVVSA